MNDEDNRPTMRIEDGAKALGVPVEEMRALVWQVRAEESGLTTEEAAEAVPYLDGRRDLRRELPTQELLPDAEGDDLGDSVFVRLEFATLEQVARRVAMLGQKVEIARHERAVLNALIVRARMAGGKPDDTLGVLLGPNRSPATPE